MTLSQLESLTEDELDLALYVCNIISPSPFVKEIPAKGLTWYRKGALEQKLLNAFNHVKPEGHAIYSSLLTKIGVQHEIRHEAPPAPVELNNTSSVETVSGSL